MHIRRISHGSFSVVATQPLVVLQEYLRHGGMVTARVLGVTVDKSTIIGEYVATKGVIHTIDNLMFVKNHPLFRVFNLSNI